MDADEREIYHYLKGWGREFVSAREICRRAGGKKRYRAEPQWAMPALARMVERGILESESGGHYRLKPKPKKDDKGRRWVSPQIAKVLSQSSKDFSNVIIVDDPDDSYYESL